MSLPTACQPVALGAGWPVQVEGWGLGVAPGAEQSLTGDRGAIF